MLSGGGADLRGCVGEIFGGYEGLMGSRVIRCRGWFVDGNKVGLDLWRREETPMRYWR